MNDLKITAYYDNIHIENSYNVSKKDFDEILRFIKEKYPDNPVILNRTLFSLKMEWTTHNALYALKIQRGRTKDVDLNYPQPLIYRLLYATFGLIAYPFIS